MRMRITVGEFPWKFLFGDIPPHLKVLNKSFLHIFEKYDPKLSDDKTGTYGYPTYEIVADSGDLRLEKMLKEFDVLLKTSKPRCAAILTKIPTTDEVDRARFLKPYYFSDFVTDGADGELNLDLFACKNCKRPNLDYVPDPLLVNRSVEKKYDVFHANAGMIVVRAWVLELLNKAIEGQFNFGATAIIKSKAKVKDVDQCFWVRPTNIMHRRLIGTSVGQVCPVCKIERIKWAGGADDLINKSGPGLLITDCSVESYVSEKVDMALVEGISTGMWPTVVMSGALLAFLKANDVKGITPFTKQLWPQLVLSEKRELPLRAQRRILGSPPTTSEKTSETGELLEAARKVVRSLRSVPWDCQKDGYVYFQLSSPEFVVVDPMTGEESDVYSVKHFSGSGLYRLPVSAIKATEEKGVVVDSGTLLFVDSKFLSPLLDVYDWKMATKATGYDWGYHRKIAEEVGTRFGICSPPPKKFITEFIGDGVYRIDAKQVKLAKV